MDKVSLPIRAALATAMVEHNSGATMKVSFEKAGFGPASGYSKTDTAQAYLRQLDDATDGLAMIEKLIRDIYRSRWPNDVAEPQKRLHARSDLELALADEGLRFDGNKLITAGVPTLATFQDAIRAGNMTTVQADFDRSLSNVERDPSAAIGSACSLLESVFKTILVDDKVPLPGEPTLKPLWKTIRNHLELTPDGLANNDVKAVLTGIAAVVSGLGDLRSHSGAVHGREREFVAPDSRLARFVVHVAQATASLIIETWQQRSRSDQAHS